MQPAWNGTGKQVAVVEYIGPYPDNISIHGNAKSANSEYVRTTLTVMTNIKDKIEVQQPRDDMPVPCAGYLSSL